MAEFAACLAESLVAVCDPIAVLLFGSWAKGTANVNSDVDLIVILPRRPSPPVRAALQDAVRVVPMHVDLLVWTLADVAAGRADPHGFPGSVLSESVVLHGTLPAIPRKLYT
ncbi:nucleotidyltransferase domain-containing protein [Rhodococcus sp. M8-35]|uniref:nucleotidyltransferase domain-containing protein n=1 Tax=Rhodococcus sp. M8-35 TaxID=3058401 RepID=UPI002ED452F2